MLLGLQERVLIGGFIFGELAHRTKDLSPKTLTRALPPSRRGHMCPRGFVHDKSVFWFATWTWPEFRSENSFGILGFRRSDDLGICCAFLFRNLSNHVYLFFCVCAFCTRLAHVHLTLPCKPHPPIVPLSLSSPLLVHPRRVCSCWLPPPFFVPSLSLSALSEWGHGAHEGLIERSRQSRGTPPRREGRHKPQGRGEPPSTPSEREREDERPHPPNACTCPPTPHEGATCAHEALGMKLRVICPLGRQVGFLVHHLNVARISIRKQFRNPWLQAHR